MSAEANAQTGGTGRPPQPQAQPSICFAGSLLDFPPSTSASLVRDSDSWNSLPSQPLSGESSIFQTVGLSYLIWEMSLLGLAAKIRSIAISFTAYESRSRRVVSPKE